MKKVEEYPVVTHGKVAFYALSKKGILKLEEDEDQLRNHSSDFSKMYYCGQDVITELRKTTEKGQ